MGQSIIKREWEYKYLILSSMWSAIEGKKKEGGDFRFFYTKIEGKHQNV